MNRQKLNQAYEIIYSQLLQTLDITVFGKLDSEEEILKVAVALTRNND